MSTSRDERPTPEQMLARVRHEDAAEPERRRGRLQIFFGYAAGVGKTYAMLRAAQQLRQEGVDVVIGYVEPHARPETLALLDGLEQLPTLQTPYRGAQLREFDLLAALARRPQVILVDEFAHTNAPGLMHAKRWQDVERLLADGIDVYTTLNVQHVESLNDVVAQITGVSVRETIPDDVFFRADEVELIDITPEELLERLREGKIYIPAQAQRAMESFFRKQNLVALREMSLRRTADRVSVDVQAARLGSASRQTWATAERLLVCVGPSPTSAKVIRTAKRLADALHAGWIAAHVQTATGELNPQQQSQLSQHLRLAEQLGAETVSLVGEDVASELVRYAQAQNMTKIVIGKSDEPRRVWWHWKKATVVDHLLQQSGEVDVYVIRGAQDPTVLPKPTHASPGWWASWCVPQVLVGTILSTAVAWLAWLASEPEHPTEGNFAMVFLLGVFLIAIRYGRRAGILASVLAVLLFDLVFVPPYFSMAVSDSRYLVTFVVMLIVALVTSTLTSRTARQAELATLSQRRAESLYRLSRSLAAAAVQPVLVRDAEQAAATVFGGEAAIFVPGEDHLLRAVVDHSASFAADASEVAVAQWVLERDEPAGRGTDTLPSAQAMYLPLRLGERAIGVLGLRHPQPETLTLPDQRRLLDTFCQQLAQALDRCRLIDATLQSELEVEKERLRSSLLSSVSHDLRTPLSVIAGASSSLLASREPSPEARRELLETIHDESQRLSRLVENLLHMTRLESGALQVNKEWHPLEDVIGSALGRLKPQLGSRVVEVKLPPTLTLVPIDSVLVEQLLVNLLENAAKYSPAGSPILITARQEPGQVMVDVADRGRGLTAGDEKRIFEKFYRGKTPLPGERGAGLGLAICRAIVVAHGGRIWAANRPDGGAMFSFTLPIESLPPQIELETDTATTT